MLVAVREQFLIILTIFFAVDWSNNRSYEVSDLSPRDVFIHCAGIAHNKVGSQDPDGQWRGNVLAAQNAVNAAR